MILLSSVDIISSHFLNGVHTSLRSSSAMLMLISCQIALPKHCIDQQELIIPKYLFNYTVLFKIVKWIENNLNKL